MELNWEYCQSNSEEILAEGLSSLCISECKTDSYSAGNYLIFHSETPYYIGEAENISKRLKTQFSLNHSTFYKNYLDYCSGFKQLEPLNIEEFQVRFIATRIGRKEIEEFGIANLPTVLNKFQKDKRQKRAFAKTCELWKDIQTIKTNILLEGEKLFLNRNLFQWGQVIVPSCPGVYRILDPDKKLIYIGESSDINIRYATHGNVTYFSALRRHIATDILGLKLINKKKLSVQGDSLVNEYLSQCSIGYMKVLFGRYEFEKFLIKKHFPLLNRKDAE